MADELAVDILLVEDNQGDIILITDAIKDIRPRLSVSIVRDGIEASNFLNHRGEFKDAPRPRIIVLDLNLPRYDGRELLAEIKYSPRLKKIPVIVLTGSNSPVDVAVCYELGANCYLVKPLDLNSLTEVIRSLLDFWFTKVKLPFD